MRTDNVITTFWALISISNLLGILYGFNWMYFTGFAVLGVALLGCVGFMYWALKPASADGPAVPTA
jgi:hypothetical protein